MPRVNWGISKGAVDSFDREKQFKPYIGKVPPNAVYVWNVYRLQFVQGADGKYPQLRIGVELLPQDKSERAYRGYRLMSFRTVANQTAFNYVPFLDVIGVSETEFKDKTIADSEGNIQRIGTWRYTPDLEILAQLKDDKDQNGEPRKDIGWIGAVDELDDDDEDVDDDEDDDDEYYDEDEEEDD